MPFSYRLLNSSDAKVLENVAGDAFDDPIDEDATRAFLEDPNHLLVVALDDANAGQIVGFVSAVRTFHPDKKAPELWINEIGVAPPFQKKGVAKELLARLFEEARRQGCREAWVLTDKNNKAALALYKAAGGAAPTEPGCGRTCHGRI